MPGSEFVASMGKGGKFETHLYYRRPNTGEQKGWIVVGPRTHVEDYTMRGFEPMWKYGIVERHERVFENAQGDAYVFNQWRPILSHPDGPAEFPAEQVMILRWYKPEDCPVPGTAFPQLAGHKIKEYKCPECDRPPFAARDGLGGVEPLGRHLRLLHSWDRASLVKYGETVGIDFDAIYSNIEQEYEFVGGVVEGKAPAQEKSDVLVGEFDCECGWKPKANAKKPGFALMMHKRTHKEPVLA